MGEGLRADVCVVGAGYAGLVAARRLTQQGASVVVLEARDRVGGRVWTIDLDDGTHVDVGGAWLGADHDALRALAAEVGVDTYRTFHEGEAILEVGGRTHRFKGPAPKLGVRAIALLAIAMTRLDRMAKRVPVDDPWTAPHATRLDNTTAAAWIDSKVRNATARELLHLLVRGGQTADPADVSMLGVLFGLHTSGGIQKVTTVEGGAQQELLVGGAQTIASRVAAELGDAVRLGSPVRKITQDADGVTIDGDGVSVRAKHAIVAMPLALTASVAFDPPVPDARMQLARSLPVGCVIKSVAIYDEPFWRADGLSGESTSTTSAVELTLDSSPPHGRPGALTCFTFGPTARAHAAYGPDERRKIVLDALTARFGARAAAPVHFVDHDWAQERWSNGCFAAHFPPGVLTRLGHALREPVGRIHWAGTETATRAYSYIDGAVRSGERAADDVLQLQS